MRKIPALFIIDRALIRATAPLEIVRLAANAALRDDPPTATTASGYALIGGRRRSLPPPPIQTHGPTHDGSRKKWPAVPPAPAGAPHAQVQFPVAAQRVVDFALRLGEGRRIENDQVIGLARRSASLRKSNTSSSAVVMFRPFRAGVLPQLARALSTPLDRE